MLIRGNHDVVNVNQLNKPIYDPDNFIRYKKAVDSAYQKGFTGRNALYTGSEQEPPQRKMAPSGLVPAYVGNILAYGLEVGIDMVPATAIPIPGIGPKSLLNTIAAVGFLALGWKTHRTRPMISAISFVASAHHVTKIIDSFRAGTFPTAFVRPAPFVQQVTPQSALSASSYQPGGVAIF